MTNPQSLEDQNEALRRELADVRIQLETMLADTAGVKPMAYLRKDEYGNFDTVDSHIYGAFPVHAHPSAEKPIEVWHGERKVTIYPDIVLRSWGPNIVSEMSEAPRTIQSVQDAMTWLFAAPSVADARRFATLRRVAMVKDPVTRAELESVFKGEPMPDEVDADQFNAFFDKWADRVDQVLGAE